METIENNGDGMKDKFIYVQDKELADKLISHGYRLLKQNNSNIYVFQNNKTLNFDLSGKKYILTDTLLF
jgi:hypothetical protein